MEPEAVPGPDNHTCSEFTPDEGTWDELKVDPPEDGEFTSEDGRLTVTLDVDDAAKVFDWTANDDIVGVVFVKAGEGGHHLYRYDPLEDADTGLTSPGEGSTVNQVSHVSFCYTTAAAGEGPTCEDQPDMEGCEPGEPTCEDQPDMEGCEPAVACPTGLTATPNQDGSIRLDFEPTEGSDGSMVYRAVEDGGFALVAELGEGVGTWLDSTSEAGTAYRYTVTAVSGDDESEDCPVAEATAIPDFPTVLAAGGAVGASLLAYAVSRRKR